MKQEVSSEKKRPEIVLPPKLCSSGDRSARLCHISLRRSSQPLAGCVWPRSHSRRRSLSPGARTSGSAASLPGRATCTSTHTSLASHWGRVREPLGRGASTSRAAPFKPLGGGGGDPGRLQLSADPAEERRAGDGRWRGERREEPASREDG